MSVARTKVNILPGQYIPTIKCKVRCTKSEVEAARITWSIVLDQYLSAETHAFQRQPLSSSRLGFSSCMIVSWRHRLAIRISLPFHIKSSSKLESRS